MNSKNVEIPEGYKIKFVKIGITEAQKRAAQKYYLKNKERLNEKNKVRNVLRYETDSEYKQKTQERMRGYYHTCKSNNE